MARKFSTFQVDFPENLKRGTNLSTTPLLSFDDLSDFIEEREKIKRTVENNLQTKLRVDFSDFSNHVFFDSAESKFSIAQDRILEKYPYNGTGEEKDAFHLTSSDYENYVFDQYPRHVGYSFLNGSTQYISASDPQNILLLGSGSLYVSAWIRPVVTTQNIVLQVVSASAAPVRKHGYDLYLSGAIDPHIKFTLYSGSTALSVSASYTSYTGSFNNVAAIYDKPSNALSLYINRAKVNTITASLNAIEFKPGKVFVGSGSQFSASYSNYDYYSGSLDEIRIMHTASEVFHLRNYSQPVNSEDYVKLYYNFNEGTTDLTSVDRIVVDYSKNGLHGIIANYITASRVSGSVMYRDPGEPILYSVNSRVVSFTGSQVLSASAFDSDNNNQIFNLIPEGILIEDEQQDGLYQLFALAMARFFDELKLYMDQLPNIKSTNYEELNDAPDLMLPLIQQYFGWKVTEHFGDADPLSFLFGTNVNFSGALDTPLIEVRNQFWRRTLNNLPYLLKSKGKRHSIDAFLNILGINKNVIKIKEYGYLPGGSLTDTRIHKDKPVYFIGIGTGSFSASFLKVFNLVSQTYAQYTVETYAQLPYISSSFTSSVTITTGSIWQMVDPNQVTGSFTLLWNTPSVNSTTGKFILTGSDGQRFSSSNYSVFDGDFVHIAAGLRSDSTPFISVRTLDNDILDLSSSDVGTVALSGIFTGSKFDFIMGANSGTVYHQHKTHGYYGEYRFWTRALSGSELDDHALSFESVGIQDPQEIPYPLRGRWSLGQSGSTDITGRFAGAIDLSQNGFTPTGIQFIRTGSIHERFLMEYNYLSPSVDLKWTENKIRIRNKTHLTVDDTATDTNEVSLEFSLVDALNEDISKIMSTIDILNNAIGEPINKYRDEYADLEALRRVYFARLGDSVNFTTFFKMFKWFDKKISDSIKQLLPVRTKFIGGQQIVESHMLERPRYKFQYPVFRTPKKVPEFSLSGAAYMSGAYMSYVEGQASGTYVATYMEGKRMNYNLSIPRPESIRIEANRDTGMISKFSDGDERIDKNFSYETVSTSDIDVISSSLNDIAIDHSGAIYTVGKMATATNGNNWIVRKSHISSSTSWTTIHEIPSTDTLHEEAVAVAIDAQDYLYVGGYISGSATGSVWAIFSSSNRGTTWGSHTGLFSGTIGTSSSFNQVNKMAIDSANNVYAVGFHSGTTGAVGRNWLTRRTLTTGSAWISVDDYNLGVADAANGVAIGSNNIIYVIGYQTVASQGLDWLIRSSSDGATWATVDYYSGSIVGGTDIGNKIAIDSNNTIYGVGFTTGSNALFRSDWLVRKSTTGLSSSWSIVDQVGISGANYVANNVYIDRDNKIYVVGYYTGSDQHSVWQVRKSTDGGSNWQLFHSYGESAVDVEPKSMAVDVSGGIYVVGVSGSYGITKKYSISMVPGFYRTKYSGDSTEDVNNANTGINSRNEYAIKVKMQKDRDNQS